MANTILAALKSGAPYIPAAPNGIAFSVDDGVSWTLGYSGASPVMGVCNTTSTEAFAITYSGHLLHSTDTGANWTDTGVINAGATSCTDIGYLGNNTLVVGNGAGAFISYNTGSSWSVLLSGPIAINKVLDMGGGQSLLMGTDGGGNGYVTKSTDYGATWTPIGTIGTFWTYDAVYAGSGVVLACGGTAAPINQVYKSTDSGATWGLAYNAGFGYWGESVAWLPATNYVFTTLQSISMVSDRPLIRSSDLGGIWSSLGNQMAVSLYGGSGSTLYSGRTSAICGGGGSIYAASIYVSLDLGSTWPRTATPFDPNRFLEISGAVAPVADFSGTPLTGIEPLDVTFTDLSTNAPSSWLWNFGDGSTGSTQHPYHTYTGIGTYTVDLTATNGSGSDTETKTDYVKVFPLPPIADFSGSPVTGSQPLGVTFMDASTGLVGTYLWNFGDGSTGSAQDPYHTYTGVGTYTVDLTVSNIEKSELNLLHQRDVYTEDPGSGYGPLYITATPSYLYVLNDYYNYGGGQNGSILAYVWNGVDYGTLGSPAGVLNPDPNGYFDLYVNSDSQIVAVEGDDPDSPANQWLRRYSFDGTTFVQTSTATLVASHNDVKVATDSNGTYAAEDGISLKAWTNDSPNLTLQDSVDIGGDSILDICISGNHIITVDTGSIRAWTFDGSSLTQTAIIAHSSYYNIVKWCSPYVLVGGDTDLAVYTFNGTSFTLVTTLYAPPSNYVSFMDYDGTYFYVTFGASAGLHVYSYSSGSWILIASRYDSLYPGSDEYYGVAKQGNYIHTVDFTSLSAYELVPLSDTETKTDYITVTPGALTASFTMNKTSGYAPLSVHFFDTSTSVSAIVSWLWSFGDGNTSTDQNPAHIYTAPGTYTISLQVWNESSLTDTEVKSGVLRVALATPSLMTHDEAPPQNDELLSHMVSTGDGSANVHAIGVRYYIRSDISSPGNSGFRRPAGPSLIFD